MATAASSAGGSASYGDCVAALRTSLSFLESSVSTLGNGVSDFPRLVNVLKTVRHYELVPQPTLAAAEASLRDEIGPAIATLLDRADAHIGRVDRHISALKARAELQQGRLEDAVEAPRQRAASSHRNKLDASARQRARAVRQRKEALQYTVERLELEVLQKERELRKRLENAATATATP
ncbi:putative mitotic spindle biogenesis protein Spc19 [Biscogniauxia sp. FL1348]|nr:putative mitotic spindle biogenesis protein Spc19 [Biscogniauxia sp. FL1348]